MNRPEQILQQHVATFLRQAVPPPPMGPVWFAPDPGVLASGEHAAKIGGIRKSMGVKSGIPDIVFLAAKPFAIELKSPNGTVSPDQKAVIADLDLLGIKTFVCRSLPEVQAALAEMGVPLKARIAA